MSDLVAPIQDWLKGQGIEAEVTFTRPDPVHGDFATSIALQCARSLQKSPREIAAEIVKILDEQPGVAEASVAGPGFINIRLSDAALLAQLELPERDEAWAGKTVLAEYGDPNPLKPLHAGHLYTALVGDAIARLIETTGARVIRLNYGGDVGLHVGRSLWGITRELGGELPEKLAEIAEVDRPQWLGRCYVTGTAAYEDDETAKAEIIELNRRAYDIHSENDHDSPLARIYWTVRQWSYDYFVELYRQLEIVKFDRFIPESEVSQLGLETVKAHPETYQESNGAVVFHGEDYGLHTRVFINSAGLPTYEGKEVGLAQIKWQDYHFDESFAITGKEQIQFFDVVYKSLEQFEPEVVARSRHLAHGYIKLKGGVKMSSRKGNTLLAMDILQAAREAGQKSGNATTESTVLAAVKYAFLKTRISTDDIIYDPQESIALEGNSGPYLQYAHARACGILRKAEGQARREPSELIGDERGLVVKLAEYHDVLVKARTELMPHHLSGYTYELTQEFNRFYENNRVLGDPRAAERLWLVDTYRACLARCLTLLGISAPERM